MSKRVVAFAPLRRRFALVAGDDRQGRTGSLKFAVLCAAARHFDDFEHAAVFSARGRVHCIADEAPEDGRSILFVARRNLESVVLAGLGAEVNGVVSEVARAGGSQGYR